MNNTDARSDTERPVDMARLAELELASAEANWNRKIQAFGSLLDCRAGRL